MADMTRGAFVFELAKQMGLEIDRSKTGAFSDAGYLDAILTQLHALGVVKGVGGGRFEPNRPITRNEAATMLARAYRLQRTDGSWNLRGTAAPGTEMGNAAQALFDHGIVTRPDFDGGAFLQVEHFAIIMQNLKSKGFNAVSSAAPDSSLDTGGASDQNDRVAERNWKQDAIRMITQSYGIKDSKSLRQFIDDAWSGGWDEDDLRVRMVDYDFFKQRFPGIEAAKFLAAQNPDKVSYIPTPEEYLQLEQGYMQVLRRAGFPPGFWDTPDDFAAWIATGRSVMEVQEDVARSYERVRNAAPEIREWFADQYGIHGDAALAAFFTDPMKAGDALTDPAVFAEIGGTASRFGFDIDLVRAERLADIGVDYSQAAAGFASLADIDTLFEESVGERTDLRAEDEGLDVAFNTDGEGRKAVEQRRRARLAEFAGGGTVAATDDGVIGLGDAE